MLNYLLTIIAALLVGLVFGYLSRKLLLKQRYPLPKLQQRKFLMKQTTKQAH